MLGCCVVRSNAVATIGFALAALDVPVLGQIAVPNANLGGLTQVHGHATVSAREAAARTIARRVAAQ